MMQTIKVNASRSYEINIGAGLLSKPPASFFEQIRGRTVMIVSDDIVYPIYGIRSCPKAASVPNTLSSHTAKAARICPHIKNWSKKCTPRR